MAASTRTMKETPITPRRIGAVVGLALALAFVALVAIGAFAMSRSASTPLIAAPANPAVTLSHGSSGDGIRADLPTSVSVQSTGNGRALLRAEYPTVTSSAQAPVSPRHIPAR